MEAPLAPDAIERREQWRRIQRIRERNRNVRDPEQGRVWSDDPRVRAWEQWDSRPGMSERVDAFTALVVAPLAEATGMNGSQVLDVLMAARRAGLSYTRALAAALPSEGEQR